MDLPRVCPRLTYANVTASVALFVALGGTSWAALSLPRNSVGSKQLRTGSVRGSEIKNRSVRSVDIRNGGVALKDLSSGARSKLRGAVGPAGPMGPPGAGYFVETNAGGGPMLGNGRIQFRGGNAYTVSFPGSVRACGLVASPASAAGGSPVQAPPGSTAIVSHSGDNALVQTYNASNHAQGLPFTLIAAC